jgi:exosortase
MLRPTGHLPGQAQRARALLLGWLGLASVWLFHAVFVAQVSRESGLDRVEEAFFDPQTTTPGLSLGVFLYLIFHRRVALRAALGSPPWRLASGCSIGIGIALLAWANSIGAPDLGRLAFVFFVVGGGFWLGGGRLVHLLAFPLLAIVLSVPLPSAVSNVILLPLQVWTAKLAALLLSGLGQSYILAGDQIVRGSLVFHVIEGCSGYRSIFSLWLATILYADLSCRSGREKLLLLAAVPIVGFVLNGFRVLVLILREVRSDASEHAIQGLVMIILGVLVLAALETRLWPILFARSRARVPGPHRVDAGTRTASTGEGWLGSSQRRLIALASLLTILALASSLWPKPFTTSPPSARLNPEEVGIGLDGWAIEGLRREPHLLGSTKFRHATRRALTKGRDHVTIFAAAEDRNTRGSSGWSPKTAIPATGWSTIEKLDPTTMGLQEIERRLVVYPDRRILVYHWRQGYTGWTEELLRDWLVLDRTPWRTPHSSVVVRVEIQVGSEADSLSRANVVLFELAQEVHAKIEHRLERERSRSRSKSEPD